MEELRQHEALLLEHAAPSDAYLASCSAAFEAMDQDRQPEAWAAYGLLLLDLYLMAWHYGPALDLMRKLCSVVLAVGDRRVVSLFLARAVFLFSHHHHHADARGAMESLSRHVEGDDSPLARGCVAMALMRLHRLQSDPAAAIEQGRRADRLFQEARYPRFSRSLLLAIAVEQDRLGHRDESRGSLEAAARAALAVRDWRTAANALTGMAECCLEGEDAKGALYHCSEALALIPEGAPRAEVLVGELLALQGLALAKEGQLQVGVDRVQEGIDRMKVSGNLWQVARRTKDLAQLCEQGGDLAKALACLREAHAMEMEETRAIHSRESVAALEHAARLQAQQEQERSARHAEELKGKNAVLQIALDTQQRLQDQLVETRRLLTLSHLMAGIAHELGTPLGNSLTSLDTALERTQAMSDAFAAGKLGKQGLQTGLHTSMEALDLARRNLGRALVLMQTYRNLGAQDQGGQGSLSLSDLVDQAWRVVGRPGLELRRGPGLEWRVELAPVVREILQQLLENVARHAYPGDAEGWVEIRAHEQEGTLCLEVLDGGCGIAAEKLGQVFDPFFSSQFGQGRSGLGLFQAQVLAMKTLHGRLRVESELGKGSCFTLCWEGGS